MRKVRTLVMPVGFVFTLSILMVLQLQPAGGAPLPAGRAPRCSSLNEDVLNVRDFGARGDDATDDTAAIQAAIDCAQHSGRNLSVMLGAGVFRVSSSLIIAGDNKGVAILGSPWASLQQGSALPVSTIRWVGGAAPVFDVSSTFTHFINFSIVNNGAATNGIKFAVGGRILLFGMSFVPPSTPTQASAFSDAAVWIDGVNYDMIDRCEFETSPAIKITSTGTTLEITRSVFDASSIANPLLKVDANIELLKIERNTFNHQPKAHVVFDNSATTNTIAVMRVVANEFDGNALLPSPSRIILGKNILNLTFEDNTIEQFPEITDSLIQLTNSRARVSGNWGSSINAPLVKTLDTTSRVFVGPNNLNPSTKGVLDDASESGGVIDVPLVGSQAILHGNLGSPSSETVYRISATDGRGIDVFFSEPPDTRPGYMTKGQRFTVMIINRSGDVMEMGAVTFSSQFKTSGEFPRLANGKSRAITFVYDGSYAVELWRGRADVEN